MHDLTGDDADPGQPIDSTALNARSQLRVPVSIEGAVANSSIGRRSATLVDLSTQGCRIDWPFAAPIDALVVLTIPGLAPVGARVRWRRDGHIGLVFSAPLHPSVLDRIVAVGQG